MKGIKHLIAVQKVKRIQQYRSGELFNLGMLLTYLLVAYTFLCWIPDKFTHPSFLQNMASMAIVLIGYLLVKGFDSLSNPIITK